jgi:RHS repeat-associated protein
MSSRGVCDDVSGQRRDASAGLLFYNARYYDPTIGRFISADTIVPSPKNPQALNRYTYAYNNPLKFVDPSGHCNSLSGLFDPCTFGYEAVVQDAYALFTFLAEATVIGTAYAPAENGQTHDIDALEESRDARWHQGILFSAYDPADYAQTIDACTSGDCDPWRIGGALVPIVSGGLSSKIGRELLKQSLKERIAGLPRHIHHIASDKSSKWTKEYERIIKPFGLDLDDSWNKIADYPHKRGWFGGGGHPDAYHQWVLAGLYPFEQIGKAE